MDLPQGTGKLTLIRGFLWVLIYNLIFDMNLHNSVFLFVFLLQGHVSLRA